MKPYRHKATALLAGTLFLACLSGEAAAQRLVGCFYQGRQVDSSMCSSSGSSGGGSSGGSYSGGGGLFYMLGGAIAQMIMGAFLPDPNEGVAERQQSVRLNNEGVELSKLGRRQEAIAKYKAAVAIDAHNAVAHANYFMERAQYDADRGRLVDALREARHAVRVSEANDEGRQVTLAAAQESVRFLEEALGQRRAQQRQDFSDRQRSSANQMRSIGGSATPSTGDLQVQPGRSSFGTPDVKPVPGTVQPDPTKPLDIKGASPQLSSAKASSLSAAGASSDEAAKRKSDCMFGTPGCEKGTDVIAAPIITGYPASTRKLVDSLPKGLADKPEVKALVDQYAHFDRQLAVKEKEIAGFAQDIAAGKGAQDPKLKFRLDQAKLDADFLKKDRDAAGVEIKSHAVGWKEEK